MQQLLLFIPQFVAIALMFFWLIRVHFARWYDGEGEQPSGPVGEFPVDPQGTVHTD